MPTRHDALFIMRVLLFIENEVDMHKTGDKEDINVIKRTQIPLNGKAVNAFRVKLQLVFETEFLLADRAAEIFLARMR